MSILTKNQLSASNQSSFPDNTTGAITPEILRNFNQGVIDTLVDSLNTGSFAITTGSNDFTQANTFTSISASSFVSASGFAGDGSRLTNITSSIALPILDEGIPVGNATSMNFTGSNISAVVVGGVAVVQVVNQNTGSLLTTASFNQYTASNDSKVNQLISATASYAISSSVAAVDAAQQAQINSLIAATGSLSNTSLNAFTQSQDTKNSTLETYTASVDQKFSNIGAQSSSWDNTNLNAFTQSQNTKNSTLASYTASLNTYTASNDTKWNTLGSLSGSFVTESETGSFARTNVTNVFTTTQTFTNISASGDIKGNSFQGGAARVDVLQTQLPANPGDLTILIPNGNLSVTSSISVTGAVTASFFKGDGSGLTNLPGQVSLTSLNSYTASNDTKWSNLAGQTGSYVTSAITASSLVTASAAGNTITFTKGDASTFNVSVVAAAIDTGSFATTASFNAYTQSNDQKVNSLISATGSYATTGSNRFVGNQTLTGSLFVSGNINMVNGADIVTHHVRAEGSNGLELQTSAGAIIVSMGQGGGTQAGFVGAVTANSVSASSFTGLGNLTTYSTSVDSRLNNLQTATASLFTSASLALTTASVSGQTLTFTKGDTTTFNVTLPAGSGSVINTGSFATTGSNFFVGIQSINEVPGTGVGEVYLLGRSGSLFISNQVSAAGGPSYASISHISSSQVNANTNLIFKDNSLTGSTIVSGSGNIFSNPTVAGTNRVNYIGGTTNLFLNGQSDQLPTITGSAASVSGTRPAMNGNIINGTQTWTINQAVNTGAHTYNNNILAGTGAWTFNMTGNTGVVTVSNNLGLTSTMTLNSPSRSVAEINAGASGSNSLTISNNSIQGTLSYNGPVSSSTHAISQNSILGTYTLNAQSSSRVHSSTGNIINGTLTFNDNTVFAPTVSTTNTFSNNNINGTTTFTLAGSSSFNTANNNLNTVTVTSFLDASAVTNAANRTSTLNANAVFGNNISILFSGSIGVAPTGRTLSTNLIAGQFISASLIGDGSGSNMFGTAILGGGLNVIGTTTIPAVGIQQNYGSAFFGRWNAEDGNRARTAQTIFAVGTGTSGSAGIVRKTGFLIDSGSNTFVEGTLNVSGSTAISGTFELTGSAFGNVVSMSVSSNTASMDFNLGNYFELSASVSPIRIEVSNLKGGVTSTLALNGVTSSTINFSSNVLQPSGSAYTASVSGSNDILSFVAFNSNFVNVVSTLKMI